MKDLSQEIKAIRVQREAIERKAALKRLLSAIQLADVGAYSVEFEIFTQPPA